jgi:O-antigen/teichoic acid export membrane protein
MLFKIRENADFKNYAYLFLANFGVLPISLISNILLARYLGPQDFGGYMYLIAVVTLFATLFTFGFFQSGARAIVLTSNKSKIKQYYGVELIILFFLYLLLAFFLFVYLIFDTNIKEKGLVEFIPILILSGWVMLMKQYYSVLFQSDKKIQLIAVSKLTQPVLFLAILLFGFYFDLDLGSVLFVFLITNILTAIFVIYNLKPSFYNMSKRIKEIWIYNKRFGFHLYIGSIFPLSLASLTGILISYNSVDNSGVGFYALALSLVSLISIIPNTIATVLFRDFSKMEKVPKIVIIYALILAIIALVGLVLIVEPFVYYLYGPDYKKVSTLVYIMVFGVLAQGMGDFFNRYLTANGYGVYLRNAVILASLITFFIIIIFIPLYKEIGAAISTLFSGLSYFLAIYILYRKVVKGKINRS